MYNITLIEGDGIGPEISLVMREVIEACGIDIQWDIQKAGLEYFNASNELIQDSLFSSIEKNKIAIKGPLTTPIGFGHRSLNVLLRQKYDLYACIRPIKSIPCVSLKYPNVDLIIFRENTEDLYMGLEEMISQDEARSIKVITRKGSTRIARAAFEYALNNHHTKVTVVTKANIMKYSDGLFLEAVQDVAKLYPTIKLEAVLVDNMCMQLVINPNIYQVIVTENLYGDILSDLCAGLVGGLGFVPGANISDTYAIFESVHGSALDIAKQDKANPSAMLLTSAMMLHYLHEEKAAEWIRQAITNVYSKPNNHTYDIGGTVGCSAFKQLIITEIHQFRGI
jgi:isocitrate dehydrogenase (NAD+)